MKSQFLKQSSYFFDREDFPLCLMVENKVVFANKDFYNLFALKKETDLSSIDFASYFDKKEVGLFNTLFSKDLDKENGFLLKANIEGQEIAFKVKIGNLNCIKEGLYILRFIDLKARGDIFLNYKMLEYLVEESSEGIVITDLNGTILWVNEGFSTITGYEKEEVIAQNPRILKSDLHQNDFYEGMWYDLKNKDKWSSYIYNRRKGGEIYSEFLSLKAIRNQNGEQVYYVGRFSDVTYLKEFQQNMQEELHLAQKIQKLILPPKLPEHPKLDFSVIYTPMEKIGGDFYDVFQIEDGLFGIFLSDISGHGVPAAMITTMVKALLETSGNFTYSPKATLDFLNKKLNSLNGELFLTAFYGVYDTKSGELVYSRSAHPYPYLIRDNEVSQLVGRGNLMLGVFEGVEFQENKLQLRAGDKLIFYTDGLTESESSEGIEFSTVLPSVLQKNALKPVQELNENIYSSFKKHYTKTSLEDDICILSMEIKSK